MKQLIISVLSLLCFWHPPLVAQEVAEPKADLTFIALYTVGELWDADKPPNEQTYFAEHSQHLAKLRREGHITMGARYAETGMLVLRAPDRDSVNELLTSDVAIIHKLFDVRIERLSPFYKGCLE